MRGRRHRGGRRRRRSRGLREGIGDAQSRVSFPSPASSPEGTISSGTDSTARTRAGTGISGSAAIPIASLFDMRQFRPICRAPLDDSIHPYSLPASLPSSPSCPFSLSHRRVQVRKRKKKQESYVLLVMFFFLSCFYINVFESDRVKRVRRGNSFKHSRLIRNRTRLLVVECLIIVDWFVRVNVHRGNAVVKITLKLCISLLFVTQLDCGEIAA